MSDIADQQEINRLNALIDDLHATARHLSSLASKEEIRATDEMVRAEKAEAEVERLKEALTEFRNFARDALPKSPALDARIDLASKALEAKP